MTKFGLSSCQNIIQVPSNNAILKEAVFFPQLVGGVTVIQVPHDATNKELYAEVYKAIRRLFRTSKDPNLHENCSRTYACLSNSGKANLEKGTRACTALRFEKYDEGDYIFSIKQADKYWYKCSRCPWPNMCRGCNIEVSSEKVNLQRSEDTCVYLAADWNLAAYVNEYQQTEESKTVTVGTISNFEDLRKKNACDLDYLLKSYFSTEYANKDQCILCERCDKRKCFEKSTAICVLPDILLISLKRFQATKRGWRKLTTFVKFPLKGLDMRDYLSKKTSTNETTYDLYGVVNHTGTLNEGHYYAFIKDASDGRWFRINDIECNEIPTESVVTQDAYVLFYQRRPEIIKHSTTQSAIL